MIKKLIRNYRPKILFRHFLFSFSEIQQFNFAALINTVRDINASTVHQWISVGKCNYLQGFLLFLNYSKVYTTNSKLAKNFNTIFIKYRSIFQFSFFYIIIYTQTHTILWKPNNITVFFLISTINTLFQLSFSLLNYV